MAKYTDNLLIALNKFDTDTDSEIEYIKSFVENMGYKLYVCTMYSDGEDGCIDLANALIKVKPNKKHYHMYESSDDLTTKFTKVLKNEYGVKKINITPDAQEKIKKLNDLKLDICISKTPMSITDNPNTLGFPKDFDVTITDINLYNGAGFITVLLGGVLTMPGLAKKSNYLSMHIDDDGNISGIR